MTIQIGAEIMVYGWYSNAARGPGIIYDGEGGAWDVVAYLQLSGFEVMEVG